MYRHLTAHLLPEPVTVTGGLARTCANPTHVAAARRHQVFVVASTCKVGLVVDVAVVVGGVVVVVVVVVVGVAVVARHVLEVLVLVLVLVGVRWGKSGGSESGSDGRVVPALIDFPFCLFCLLLLVLVLPVERCHLSGREGATKKVWALSVRSVVCSWFSSSDSTTISVNRCHTPHPQTFALTHQTRINQGASTNNKMSCSKVFVAQRHCNGNQ